MDDKFAELSSDEPVTYTHHLHPGAPTYMRRGSLKPPDGAGSKNGLLVQQRPVMQGRTNSAPSVEQHKHFTQEPHLTGRYLPNGLGNEGDDDDDDDQEQFYSDYDDDNDDNDDNDDAHSNYNEYADEQQRNHELNDHDIDNIDDKNHEYDDEQDERRGGHSDDRSATRFSSFPTTRSLHVAPAWHNEADDYAPPVPPTRFDSLPASMLEDRITEINVAVIGAAGVGKTTFLQKALDLSTPPHSGSAEQKIAYHSTNYLVRLLEIPIDKVNVDDDGDDNIICWPDTIGNKMTPKIDGALTLYDVRDKSSLDQVPEVLTALSKASVPSILISCKCDVAPFERDLDPVAIEEKAKRSVRNLVTLQTSNATSDNHKRGISMIIRAITARAGGEIGAAKRRRAQSNALRHVSPKPAVLKKHIRATSEHSSIALRADKIRHEPRLVPHGSADQLNLAELPADTMQRSFLFEESGTDSSNDSSGASNAEDVSPAITSTANQLSDDGGSTFDQLVDRLLAQPMSKSDVKFSTIFLALYRKFAAPARLLEGIVDRFDAVDRLVVSELTKTTAQLRYLTILEQWISHYPGDFAFPKTKRKIQSFIARIGPIAVLSAAANEMTRDLAAVHDNDDTHWAFNDEDRETDNLAMGYSALPTSQQRLDELEFSIPESLSGLTVTDGVALAATLVPDSTDRPATESSTSSSQMMLNVNVAQREAQQLEPTERLRLSKDHWRMLMDIPDDVVASELTRMDWIMFSSIRPRDLVRHVSLNPIGKEACANLVNVDRMINHFNRTAAWVSNFILLRDKPKHRSMMLEKFMRVARKLRELNNYNSLGAIIAGIKSSPIHRLAATRELLSPAVGKDWLKLEILLSPTRSHSAYRLAWENSPNERIPYIPLHRRDLVSAEEGNKTFVGDDAGGRINWKKFEIMGEVIVGLQRAQDMPYHGLAGWKGGEQVSELLLDVQLIRDEEDLYKRSIQCEPPANTGATTTTARFKDFFKR